MSEEKKEGSCCSTSGCGCGCGKFGKFLAALFVGAFIFAAGMWFAKANCHGCGMMGGHQYCPFSAPASK